MEKVLYRTERRVAYVTLNRPAALNALDDDLALRLEAINGYSCVGDFSEVRRRIASFAGRAPRGADHAVDQGAVPTRL